jgi:hypothetical protein
MVSDNLSSRLPNIVTYPDGSNLYYKNIGLFSDPYLENLKNHTDGFWGDEEQVEKVFSSLHLHWEKWKEFLPKMTEPQIESDWITKVFKELGFSYHVQDRQKFFGKTEIPDYTLFENDEEKQQALRCENVEGHFHYALACADAKAMYTPLDGSKMDKKNPSYQIWWYLNVTKKDWGILTDGRYWRLYSSKTKSKYASYYEVDIGRCLAEKNIEAFKYFYFLFRKEAFAKDSNRDMCFLDRAHEGGERYAHSVEKNLKERAFVFVERMCQGFLAQKKDTSEKHLEDIYQFSLHFLFRLMFILNCEAKGILDVKKQGPYFKYSLRKICISLCEEKRIETKWAKQSNTYAQIVGLFKLLSEGDSSIGVVGFGSHAFDQDCNFFIANNTVSDDVLNRVLLELTYSYDEVENQSQIDYKILSADHLGSIFEGLLEYKLGYCPSENAYVLLDSNGVRKKTGSYYTPTHIVDLIVSKTIAPLLKNKSVTEMLSISVLDPAMGSGHFLLGAVRFIEEAVLEAQRQGDDGVAELSSIRNAVLNGCIYGVDLNPLAVALGKFSLWMYSVQNDRELEPLDHQLKWGNSLISPDIFSADFTKRKRGLSNNVRAFDYEAEFAKIFVSGGFDAIIGNPPYVFTRSNGHTEEEKNYYKSVYSSQNYQTNTYSLFIERSFGLAKSEGRVGMITPNNWCSIPTMQSLRHYIGSKCGDLLLINMAYRVFSDAEVDTAIVVFEKKRPAYAELYVSKQPGNVDFIRKTSADEIATTKSINFSNLGEHAHTKSILEKISRRSTALMNYADVRSGLVAYEVGKGTPIQTSAMTNRRIYHATQKVNRSYLRYLDGVDVCRYALNWSGQWIQYGDNLAAPRKTVQFDSPRILVRQIPSKPPHCINATFVRELYINDRNSNNILAREGLTVDLEFILGIINSKLTSFWFDVTYNKHSRGLFPQFKVCELKQFPIPISEDTADFREFSCTVTRCAKEITALITHNKIQDAAVLSKELDDLLYGYYGLNEEEIIQINDWETSSKSPQKAA